MPSWKLSNSLRFAGISAIAVLALISSVCQAQQPTAKPIRVALYADKGADS